MSEKTSKSFDIHTWVKGHRGVLAPHATDRAHIENLRLYRNGLLGPRHPWEQVVTWSTGGTDVSLVVPLTRFITTNSSEDGFAVFEDNEDVDWRLESDWLVDYSNTTTFFMSMTDGDDPQQLWVSRVNEFTILVNEYLIENRGTTELTTTVASRTAAPFSYHLARTNGSHIHNGRAYYWGEESETPGAVYTGQTRIYYSDVLAYTTFTSASQYFEIDGPVAGCYGVGANLFIWDTTGKWYVLRGRGDPADGILTDLGEFRIPNQTYARVPAFLDDSLYFLGGGSKSIVRVNASPDLDDISLSYLSFSDEDAGTKSSVPVRRPVASSIHNIAFLPHTDDSFHYFNGVWTLDSSDLLGSLDHHYFFDDKEGYEYLLVQRSTTHELYRRNMSPGAPKLTAGSGLSTSGETHSTGDTYTLTGTLKLPRIEHPNFYIRPLRVKVDGVMYGDTSYAPDFDVSVELPWDSSGSPISVTLDNGPSLHVTDRTLSNGQEQGFRSVHTAETDGLIQYASYADISLTNIINVAIERVTVEYEISKSYLF